MGKKRFKKIRWLPSDDVKDFILGRLGGVLTAVLILAVAWALVVSLVNGSDYFKLRSVETKGLADPAAALSVNKEVLKAYKYRNIFAIDTGSIARMLSARYPDAKNVVVMRALPDKLIVTFVLRVPVAVIKARRYYAVDREGCVFVNAYSGATGSLPSIMGIEIAEGERTARKPQTPNLTAALRLLEEMRRTRFLSRYRPISVNAGDGKNISFTLNGDVEVRIGDENFKERLALLERTLRNPRLILDKIRYIDVRFQDAVIGPKEAHESKG